MKPTLRRGSGRRLARVEKVPESGLDKLRGQAKKTSGQLRPYGTTAREVAKQRVTDAREWAAPRLEDAAVTVQRDVAPRVATALSKAAERSAPARAEAQERGTAALAAIKGEKTKKRRRWPLALLFLVIGGAAGAAGGIASQRGLPPVRATGAGTPAAPPPTATSAGERSAGPSESTSGDGQGNA